MDWNILVKVHLLKKNVFCNTYFNRYDTNKILHKIMRMKIHMILLKILHSDIDTNLRLTCSRALLDLL